MDILLLAVIGMTVVLVWAVAVLPFWMIFQKAGFPGVLSLLMLVPLLNVVMLFFLAFADWPALRSCPEDDFQVGRD